MDLTDRSKSRSLWASLLAAPIAFILNLQINYALVDVVCRNGMKAGLHLISLFFVFVPVIGAVVALRLWIESPDDWPLDSGSAISRTRFMSLWAITANAFFLVATVALWIPIWILSPCQR